MITSFILYRLSKSLFYKRLRNLQMLSLSPFCAAFAQSL